MPTVKTYGGRQVRREALPGVRKTAAETALSSGAGLEEARAQKFETIAGVAGGIARLTVEQAARERAQATQRADEVADLAAETKLARWEEERVYHPTSGVLTVKGEAAMPLPDTVRAEFEKVAGTIEAGLHTDAQRVAFARTRERHRVNLVANVSRHVEREVASWEASELQGFVKTTTSLAISNALDPRRVGDDLRALEERIRTSAPHLGLGPAAVARAVAVARSAVHVGVLKQLVATDRTGMASHYFAAVRDQIDGPELADVERALGTATTAVAALQASEALWIQHGPTTDDDPIHLDVMETAARARFATDPATLKATIESLRERKAGVDAGRLDRKEAVAGALWGAIAKGATLADVRRMPEYLTAPGRLQVQVSEHIVDQAEQRANRVYTLGQREDAAVARVETAAARKEAEKERAGWSMLWHYDTPAVLAQMTDNQVLALMPDLGIDHVNRLMTKKRALVKSDESVRAATMDDDLFKTTAQSAGLDPYGSQQSDLAKANLGQLRNTVETAIDREQQATGKALTRDRKQAIMQGIVDRKVMMKWTFGDTSGVAALVINPKERAAAYVPIAEIPESSLLAWVNVIRGEFSSAQRLSRDQILRQYRDRIQRAHAASLLRLGAEEERRRLRGQ